MNMFDVVITGFAISSLLGGIGFIYMHEQAHVEVNLRYGIESTVDYFSEFPYVITTGEKPCPTNECKLGHDVVDAIGYHLQLIYGILVFGFMGLFILMESLKYE